MARPKALGRGLDVLLPVDDGVSSADTVSELSPDLLRPGRFQPRTKLDDASLAELADSIRVQGVIQPIVVRPVDAGKFEIIAGERRWRAAQLAGLKMVPVIVRMVGDDAALAMALIENIQREDLNPLDEANGIQRLIHEFGMTHESAARAVGRSRSAVSNLLRLLNLPQFVQNLLLDGRIEMGHARALLAAEPQKQVLLAQRVASGALSVRETEQLVTTENKHSTGKARPARNADRDHLALEERLSDSLGTRVRIYANLQGRGKLVIEYSSLDQLEPIINRLA